MGKRRLLVIDDSLTIRKLVELSLKATSFATEFAATGLEGIQKATSSPPDLILLDFVLPDMRGTDVCAELARDVRTSWTPIIVMSAKDDNVRELFQEFPAVADFVAKPFKAADIVARVERIAAAPPSIRSGASSEGMFDFRQKEAAAQALYAKFRPLFASIPELMSGLGGAAPAQYFARKLLTPALMGELLEALVPTLKDALGSSRPKSLGTAAFGGSLGRIALIDFLSLLEVSRETGELEVTFADRKVLVFLREGAIALVTQAAKDADTRGSPSDGRRLLLAALRAPSARIAWRAPTVLPDHAEAFAQPLAVAQLRLELMRVEEPRASAESTLERSLVFERAPGFSRKVPNFDLTDAERRILTLIDGRSSVEELGSRAALDADETGRVFRRLAQVELIHKRPDAARVEPVRPVLVVDPDVEAFQRSLERLLSERAAPISLVGVGLDEELFPAIEREKPRMVILNATALGSLAGAAARAVRSSSALSDLALVAVLDAPAARMADELAGAGFDAVLTKPLLFSDLERLLVA